VCFAKKLIVELDGWTHGLAQNYEHDDIRQAWLEDHGFTVLRFTDEEVMEDRDAVGDAIFTVLESVPKQSPLDGGIGRPEAERGG
jgi:very-short-patch-repair endonuclease